MGHEIDFLPVGNSNGDAICIRYGEPNAFYVHVIDGAFKETGATIVAHIQKYYGPNVYIDHMVLSHADNDHAPGLIAVLQNISVKTLWMNRPWLYAHEVIERFHGNYTYDGLVGLVRKMRDLHPYLIEMEEIAAARRITVNPIFQGTSVGQFIVLAPSQQRYISLIPDLDKTPQSYEAAKGAFTSFTELFKALTEKVKERLDLETLDHNPPATSASNETSVVQLGNFNGNTVLLTADVGPAGLNEAADFAELLGLLAPPSIVQIPHHGSRRNVTPAVLNRWLGAPVGNTGVKRGTAFVSIGKDADIYPRKKVKNAFIRRGYDVIATRGSSQSHRNNFPARFGWVDSTHEQFSEDVED